MSENPNKYNQPAIVIPMRKIKRISSFSNYIDTDEMMDEGEKDEPNSKLSRIIQDWDKYVYTSCILIIYLSYGINNTLFPTAMEDFKYMFETTLVKITYGETFGVIGYLIGSLCGFFYNYVNRQLTFIVMVAIQGIFIAVQPYTQNLGQLYAALLLWEMGGASFDSGNAVWIIEMWGKGAPAVLQLAQMMYGLGTIIGPLIIEPYVVGDLTVETTGTPLNSTIYTANLTIFNLNETSIDDVNYSVDRRANLATPFMIGGGTALAIPIVLLVMFFVKKYKTPENETQNQKNIKENDKIVIEDNSSVEQPSELSPRTRYVVIAFMALILMAYNGIELTFLTYCSTFYQSLPIKISAPKAAQLMSIFSATYTLGRLLTAYISLKLRADIILIYHMLIIMASMAVLFFEQTSELAIHIGMAMIGFGFSAMWPSLFAFAEFHIKLNDKITSIFAFVATFLFLIAPFIISPLIESRPDIFLYVIFGYFCIVIVLFIITMLILKVSKKSPIIYRINE